MRITVKAKVLGIFFATLALIVICQAAVYFATLDRLHHLKVLYDSTVLQSDANNLRHLMYHRMLALDDYLLVPDENHLNLLAYAARSFDDEAGELMSKRAADGAPKKNALMGLLGELGRVHDAGLRRAAGPGARSGRATSADMDGIERVEKEVLGGIAALADGRPQASGAGGEGEGWREKVGGLFSGFLPEFEDSSDIRQKTRGLLGYQAVRNLSMQMKIASRRFLITGDERYVREFHRAGSELDRRVGALLRGAAGGFPREKDTLEFIRDSNGAITAAFGRAVRAYRAGGRREAHAAVMGTYVNEEMLDTMVSGLVEDEDIRFNSAYDSLDPIVKYSVSFTRALLFYLMIVAGAMALLVYAAVTRMVRPIVRLGEASRKVARGDWTQRLEVRTRDEIGDMAASFNTMTGQLEKAEKGLLKRNMELSDLYDLSASLSGAISLDALLEDVMDSVVGLLVCQVQPRATIFMVEGGRLKLVSHTGHPGGVPYCSRELGLGDCLCGLAAKTGEIIVSARSVDDDRHVYRYPDMPPHGHVVVPLRASDAVVGVICLYLRAEVEVDEDRKRLLYIMGGQIGTAISNAKLYEETRALSLRDALTGLANRRMMDILLDKSFGRARRLGTPFSVIMLDIDHFKRYNDTFGHPAGDALLVSLAKMLSEEVREIDLVVRYGGEEFFVLLPDADTAEARAVAERLRGRVEAGSDVTISVGVSAYAPGVQTGEDIIKQADEALYRAKQGGRNRVEVFAAEKAPGAGKGMEAA